MIERLDEAREWQPLGTFELINSVAPVKVLISNGGQYIATLDNWHSAGHGQNAIVIYAANGRIIRQFAVSELVGLEYFEALPRSVSSVQWKASQSLSAAQDQLVLGIRVPAIERDEEATIEWRIDLKDGTSHPPPAMELAAANLSAGKVLGRRAAAEAERVSFLKRPLVGPTGCELGDWQDYVREAYWRLTPNWLDSPVPGVSMLAEPSSRHHQSHGNALREYLTDLVDWPDELVIAGPCAQDELSALLLEVAADLEQGSLEGSRLYIVGSNSFVTTISTALAHTGAVVVGLDPLAAIPQRPERVPGSAEQKAAEDERRRRQSLELESMIEAIE